MSLWGNKLFYTKIISSITPTPIYYSLPNSFLSFCLTASRITHDLLLSSFDARWSNFFRSPMSMSKQHLHFSYMVLFLHCFLYSLLFMIYLYNILFYPLISEDYRKYYILLSSIINWQRGLEPIWDCFFFPGVCQPHPVAPSYTRYIGVGMETIRRE